MPVILKDIARALNVSVITVSKVMRDQPDVAAETRKRVLAKAQELGYRPNLTARSLVTGKSSQVGVIVPTLLHPFFAEVLEGLSSAMKQAGYAVMISSSMEDPVIEEAAIEQLLGHRMDGLIVASCSFSPTKFKQLREQGIPFVLIDRFFPGFRTDFVGARVRLFLLGLLGLITSIHPSAVQAQTAGEGTITGTVTDSSGAVIVNAAVTATAIATNVSATRTTSKNGLYSIAPLEPGTYTVTVEATGFKTLKQENLDVVGLGELGFNPVMSIGATTETVDVTAAPPVLDTDSSTLGAVIENSAYSGLPLEASATQERDPTAFALLVQGAMPGTDGRLPSLSGTPGHQI